ncbi:hypothetical protein L2E82_03519 [Cichorium intybus]|uniref:Uncharacterized protein n=1 Tax=Cichorium intybus TaxID=13427 RepID=A0ACB9H3N6_CICIN|nr:hypothetical protein L2E82_03519 [Cichorium intybus]
MGSYQSYSKKEIFFNLKKTTPLIFSVIEFHFPPTGFFLLLSSCLHRRPKVFHRCCSVGCCSVGYCYAGCCSTAVWYPFQSATLLHRLPSLLLLPIGYSATPISLSQQQSSADVVRRL